MRARRSRTKSGSNWLIGLIVFLLLLNISGFDWKSVFSRIGNTFLGSGTSKQDKEDLESFKEIPNTTGSVRNDLLTKWIETVQRMVSNRTVLTKEEVNQLTDFFPSLTESEAANLVHNYQSSDWGFGRHKDGLSYYVSDGLKQIYPNLTQKFYNELKAFDDLGSWSEEGVYGFGSAVNNN